MSKERLSKRTPTLEEFNAITSLASQLQAAKLAEAVATQTRITLEAKIASLISCGEEGQRTINLADKSKVVVKRGLIYTADVGKILDLGFYKSIGVPAPIESKTTRTLDVLGYKWYKENQPAAYCEIAKFVEVKPKKTAVTIKQPPAAKK